MFFPNMIFHMIIASVIIIVSVIIMKMMKLYSGSWRHLVLPKHDLPNDGRGAGVESDRCYNYAGGGDTDYLMIV